MRLSMLGIVTRTADARAELQKKLSLLDRGGTSGLVVTIDGERQDDAMLALVKPFIAAELRGRINSLERDLQAQGVVIGD